MKFTSLFLIAVIVAMLSISAFAVPKGVRAYDSPKFDAKASTPLQTVATNIAPLATDFVLVNAEKIDSASDCQTVEHFNAALTAGTTREVSSTLPIVGYTSADGPANTSSTRINPSIPDKDADRVPPERLA